MHHVGIDIGGKFSDAVQRAGAGHGDPLLRDPDRVTPAAVLRNCEWE